VCIRPYRLLVVVALALACGLPTAASAATSPSQLLSSMLAAARTHSSVHYVTAASFAGVRVSQVGAAGAGRGSQRITYRNGVSVGHVTVLVAANTAYMRGDEFALVDYMGLKAASAARYAGRWILIPHADKAYATIAAGVTFSSVIAELTLAAPLTRAPDTTIGGLRVVGVKGSSPNAAPGTTTTLYARAAGRPLPVREVAVQGKTRGTVTLSGWDGPVHVTAPADPVPISRVRRG
jgi:hypothetical protein